MAKSPTLADVARRAGVHTATASRALNPATRRAVNPRTARRVIAAAQEIGYSPNVIARALRTAKTGTIGVVLPDLTNPIFPPLVRGIEDALRPHGYTALLADTDNDDAREREALAAFQGRQVDGLLVSTARRTHPILEDSVSVGVPIVLVSRQIDGGGLSAVTGDDAHGVAQAFEHLWVLGHRRIGHLAGPRDVSTGDVRARAFAFAAEHAAGDRQRSAPVVECERFSEQAGAAAMSGLLEADPSITAVLAANDLIALGAISTLERAGRRCPEDFSVIGFNDMAFLDRMSPPLTTVRIPYYHLGAEAAKMLLERLEYPDGPPKTLLLPTRLVVRGSTAPPGD